MTAIPQPPASATQPPARLAGVLYLIIILCGVTAELALRGPILSAQDPLGALSGALPLFRASLLADVVMVLADVAIALVFFVLLRGVAPVWALAATVLRLMQAVLIAFGLVLLAAVPGLAATGQAALAQLLLGLHGIGYDIGLVFFGAGSLIMAWLLCQSGGVPRWIAAALGASGLVYIGGGALRLAAPGLTDAYAVAYALPLVAETGLCLWLLIRARV